MDAKLRANFIHSVASGDKILCPKCNAMNEADSKFCETCGAPINVRKAVGQDKVVCPMCGVSNEPGAKFCFSCGKDLESTQADDAEDKEKKSDITDKVPFASVKKNTPVSKKTEEKHTGIPFAPVKETTAPESQTKNAAMPPAEELEERSAFAEGLPDWDITPPQVVVRRRKK